MGSKSPNLKSQATFYNNNKAPIYKLHNLIDNYNAVLSKLPGDTVLDLLGILTPNMLI